MKNIISAIIFCLVGSACSSAPAHIEYYVLNTVPASGLTQMPASQCNKPLIVKQVMLSSYLRQSGLIIQTRSNQMQVSNTHLWAEKLDAAIPKLLVYNFQQLSNQYQYYLNDYKWLEQQPYDLIIRIDNLQPTTDGEVITSGRFYVIDTSGSETPLVSDFSFKLTLTEDGHAHAVSQMGTLIGKISQSILDGMKRHFQACSGG